MFFDHYPYTNFHNINLDWVLQAVKAWGQTVEANDRAFRDLKEANEDFKRYVTNYLQDLDITDEINTKLDAMLASGVLTPYFAPYVKGYVDSWLASHVTPTSPALDSTLTLSGAAARADSTGKRLKDLAYVDALSTPEVIASLNRSQVLPGYRVQGITYDYNGHYYVCGGSVDEDGTGVIVKMTKPDFSDAEISVIPQLGHANDITYYDGYLYVCTVGGGNAPQWGIYKINVNDFTDKTLISNAPENTIGISYRQGDFWVLAPYRIYRTTDFTSYEVVVANTNDLLTAYGIPTEGRISQTIFRAAGYLIGWVCSFVFEDRHYGALTFFNSTGEPVAFKMFPAYHSEIQGAVYADMSIYLVTDGNMVNVFRMDPRHLSYVQLKAGDDLNSFTGRSTLYSTGSNVSAALLNSPSTGEGFTVQVDRLGVYNTIQTARTNSGRGMYRIKSFNSDTWGEWIEPAAEVAQIKEDLSEYSDYNPHYINFPFATHTTKYGTVFTRLGINSVYADTSNLNQNLKDPDVLLFYDNTTSMPVKAGKTYTLDVTSSNDTYLKFQMWVMDSSDNRTILYSGGSVTDKEIKIPSSAVKFTARLFANKALGSGTLTFSLLDEAELSPKRAETQKLIFDNLGIIDSDFVVGVATSSGTVNTSPTYANATKDIVSIPFDVNLKVENGYQFFLQLFNSEGAYSSTTSWVTNGYYHLSANQKFMLTITLSPLNSSYIASENEFKTCVRFERANGQWVGKKWYAFGTSISDTSFPMPYELPGYTGKYPPYLAQLSGLVHTNYAIGGSRITNAATADRTTILQKILATDLSDADIITIDGFVNDFGACEIGDLESLTPENADDTTLFGAMFLAITHCLQNSNAVVCLLTDNTGKIWVTPQGQTHPMDLRPWKKDGHGKTQNDYQDAMRKIAKYLGCYCIDAGSMASINYCHPEYLQDTIHQSEAGGKQYANAIWSVLKDIQPNIPR